MARTRRVLSVMTLLTAGAFAPVTTAAAQDASAEQLWSDFAHYVLIARPALAANAAQALLDADAGTLLDSVEASDHASPAPLFDRAAGMAELATLASQLEDKIESARLDRSRDTQRIADNIERLDDGARPYANAVGRLRAAGQYAASQLLDTIRQTGNPSVLRAMVDIGQPLVAPLSAALPGLEPVAQGQIAQVLGEIGYPYAMAALQRVIDHPDTDPTARRLVQRAFDQLAEDAPQARGSSAAELYLAIGQGAYGTGTAGQQPVGFDASKDAGLLWKFGPDIGLVPLEVPASVYADALARDAASTALSLNPDLAPALSLFLAADLRAGNNLNDANDPSRPIDLQPAEFYALLAGPERLRDVLDLAITDGDAALALDAIDALARTASIEALQPLTLALAYPDRRVRFEAALALAHAMPDTSFEGSSRVVAVLAEAVRQGQGQIALVLAEEQDTRNTLSAAAANLGYETFAGSSLADVGESILAAPGIDLILMQGSADAVIGVVEQSRQDYKLAGTPVVAAVNGPDQTELTARYGTAGRVATLAGERDVSAVGNTVQTAMQRYAGSPITGTEAEGFATRALAYLDRIATDDSVYDVADAGPALLAALNDPRDTVAIAAADVLAKVPSSQAQAALAAAALDGFGDVQLAHLDALAQSANRFGSRVDAETGDALLDLVRESSGELAIAAAMAHGALNLPTAQAVELIFEAQ